MKIIASPTQKLNCDVFGRSLCDNFNILFNNLVLLKVLVEVDIVTEY